MESLDRMTRKPQARGLGRGLSALIGEEPQIAASSNETPTRVPIELIRPNPDQPRRSFAEEDLVELAASIREKGVIQPLVVRKDPGKPGAYQIVAGERRWRAAQLVQLHELPVVVRDFSDDEALEVAIIENIQRADLNPVEEAAGYRQLMDRFSHTQEKLAEVMGKSRSHIANALRLLSLPEVVIEHLRAGRLSAGHARALVTASDPAALAEQVIARGLSVRQTEALAKAQKIQAEAPRKPARADKDADTRALEADLSAAVGLKIAIDHKQDGAGEVRVRYGTLEELDTLCQLLSR
ncbi:MAG: ParB family chromosome partitioning protein [Paracoccaceae bacterium]|jgi:ParB family chromosome partitioning protein